MISLIKHHKLYLSILSIILGIISIISLQKNNLNTEYNQKNTIFLARQEASLKITLEIQNRLPSFSFNNLIADWNYLQFIQYFGDLEAREITGYPLVTNYFETVIAKDPYFTQAFLSFSTANSLFAARPEKTVELINRVLDNTSPNLPGYPFLLWTYKATDEILFLGDLKAARNSYLMAAKWASLRQDDIGNEMAQRYHKTADFLASNPSSTQARFGAWMTVLSETKDQKTQDYILDRLEDLGAEISISPEGKLLVKPPSQT